MREDGIPVFSEFLMAVDLDSGVMIRFIEKRTTNCF